MSFLQTARRNAFWRLNCMTIGPALRFHYNIAVDAEADPFPEPPFVCVSNHGTFFDPWIIGVRSPHALSIMMNDDGFRSGAATRWYLNAIGAFPKKKGAHDFVAMKRLLGLLRNGAASLIFPEGQTTWDGRTQPVYAGIERIIKRTGSHLVITRLEGNFLSRPWWAHAGRKGQVRLYRRVLPASAIKDMSERQVLSAIIEGIRTNEIANPRNRQFTFRGRNLALGLERLLWLCPQCREEDTLITEGDRLRCDACGGDWRLSAHGDLFPVNQPAMRMMDLTAWADMQKTTAREKLQTPGDAIIAQTRDAVLQTRDERDVFIPHAAGTLALARDRLLFTDDAGKRLQWPTADIRDYVIQKKDIFECRVGDQTLRFVFNHKSPMKWLTYFRSMHEFWKCEERGYQ